MRLLTRPHILASLLPIASALPVALVAQDRLPEASIPRNQAAPRVVLVEAEAFAEHGGWESGFDRDPILDMERVRDQDLRAMYGAWDAIKNVETRYPAHRLNWVAYIAGKRESRRLLGDGILTAEDLRDDRPFEDGCFPCTWGIDTHCPHPAYEEGHAGDGFIADHTPGAGYTYKGPYWVPYRCLYSRNVADLFMAGRNISVSHEALSAVRVMKTTGAMGEVLERAVALCREHDCDPREVYANHLDERKALLRRGVR